MNFAYLLYEATRENLSDLERRDLVASIRREGRKRTVFVCSSAVISLFLFGLVLVFFERALHSSSPAFLILIGFFVVYVILTPIAALAICAAWERKACSIALVQKAIRPSVCLRCLYDLKGTHSQMCPECGEPLASPREEQQ
ncbi:MAG: hypothetical protein AAGB26_16125 [Planctomycetota bacterium]